jgi:hypothetical protein
MHINKVIQKAHNTLSFSSRNISHWPTNIKAQCYSILEMRSSLEYALTDWSQAKNPSINQIKAVQRRVVRFASGNYRQTNTIIVLMKQFDWTPLEVRCNNARLVMMYRIVYDLADIPPATYIQQS